MPAFRRDVLGFDVWEIGDHSCFAYIEADDVDALYATLVERGAPVIKPLRTEPWGMREFGVRTVDGHRIMSGGPTTLARTDGSRSLT